MPRTQRVSSVAALFVLLLHPVAAAAQTVYTLATSSDTCPDPPGEVVICTRGALQVVDARSMTTSASVDVWRHGRFRTRPIGTWVSPSGNRVHLAWTPGLGDLTETPSAVTVVETYDASTLAKIADVSIPGSFWPRMTLSPDGSRLFVADSNANNGAGLFRLGYVDLTSHAFVTVVPNTEAVTPVDITSSPSGDRLIVSVSDATIRVYRTDALNAAPFTFSVSHVAGNLAMSSDGSRLYAIVGFDFADPQSPFLIEVDPSAGAVLRGISHTQIAPGINPDRSVLARGRLYVVTTSNVPGTGAPEGLGIYDLATMTRVGGLALPDPVFITASADQAQVLVSGFLDSWLIETATNAVVGHGGFQTWPAAFAPPAPVGSMAIDTPSNGLIVEQPFALAGWAVDVQGNAGGPGVDTVHVWAYPAAGGSPLFVGAADYGLPRSDVAAIFGSTYLNCGYQLSVRGLAPGRYTLVAFAHSSRSGTFTIARTTVVDVVPSLHLNVDIPTTNAIVRSSFVIAGWALDRAAPSGSGVDAVHVWAYPNSGGAPQFAGAATLGDPRPDVAAVFGDQFHASGFHVNVNGLAPGAYSLVVFARQASTGAFTASQTVGVTVSAPTSRMAIDLPAPGTMASSPIRISGWAIDTGAAAGTGVDAVHVWAYPDGGPPMFLGAPAYGFERPDVGAVFGLQYAASGYDLTAPLSPGTYTLVVSAHSTTATTFTNAATVVVIVK